MVRIAINGFGRIGRHIARALMESARPRVELVAINDLASVDVSMHLLQYDSVHGALPGKIAKPEFQDGKKPKVNLGQGWIPYTAVRDPEDLPWGDLGVDVALECTGIFTTRDAAARHLKNGSQRVLVSAPAADVDKTIVYGVNHHTLTADDKVMSNASCTTNCLAPLADVLHNAVGIEKGYMTTIHSYTADQRTVDSAHKDFYRARAAALSMIPTSTGAAKAIGLILPQLNGRLAGTAIRVPTPDVSLVDLTFTATRATTVEEINAAMHEAASGRFEGIIGYFPQPLVSADFIHCPVSTAFAPAQTAVVKDTLVRVMAWYDNEWGFSNRMIDTACHIAAL